MFGRSAKTSGSRAGRKGKRSVSQNCPRCRVPVRASAPRCPGCGNRLFFASPTDAKNETESPPAVPAPDPLAEHDLSEIQKRILSAAVESGAIFVYRIPGPGEGEVKSGSERFFGDEAVTAVATLIAPGLVAAVGEDRFELTRAGLRLAGQLA